MWHFSHILLWIPFDPYGNTYQHDSFFGNLVTRISSGQSTTFEYDDYNLLKKINWPDQTSTQFLSDAAGNRIAMTTSEDIDYNFIYDTTAGIPAVLMEHGDSQDPRLYIRTPDGRLIARVTAIASPTLDFYYHFDGLGSTRGLTDSSGTVTDSYTYDAWGQVSHSGLKQQPYQFVGQLGYYTHYQDPKLSNGEMLQLGVRYYMPGLGRFTQRDRIRIASVSDYSYAWNWLLRVVDPSGKTGVIPDGGVNNNGRTHCSCRANMYPEEPPTDVIDIILPGIEIIADSFVVTRTRNLGNCRPLGRCWFFLSRRERVRRREAQRRFDAYAGCLDDECEQLCHDFPDIPKDSRSQQDIVKRWRDGVNTCYDRNCN